MNINQIINAKSVNLVILKQKMINVYIAVRKNMVVQLVMNMDISKIKTEKILMILYAKIAIHILRIFTMMIIMSISALLYLLKENAIIVNMIYLKTV